jgi:V8-like Glu-specific endopeptidase
VLVEARRHQSGCRDVAAKDSTLDALRVRGKATEPAPHAPDWVARHYHPTLSASAHWAQGPVERDGERGQLAYGIYPPDDRQVYYPTGYPWHCVGRLFAWNDLGAGSWSWWGSGVLIGPRHVLTAGHVVPWDGTSWGMLFVPAYYDGSSLLGAGATSWVSDAWGWDASYRNRLPRGDDIAVVRLYEPLGDALGHFGSKTYLQEWNNLPEFYLMGYPFDVAGAERPSFERRIPVLRDDEANGFAKLEHHADFAGGDSGGPFWSFWPDGFPYVVGTLSGGFVKGSDDFNVSAGGAAMVNLVIRALNEWQ